MTTTCRNICHLEKNARKYMYRYEDGYKRCTNCDIAFQYEGLWCPCCGGRVRGRAYGRKERRPEVARY